MKESFQVLLRGLRHSSMQLRLTGLFLVRDHWPQLEEAVSECLRMAFDDSDPVVRGTALWILRRFYAWIDDPAALLNQVLSVTLDPRHRTTVKQLANSSKLHVSCLKERREEWRQ